MLKPNVMFAQINLPMENFTFSMWVMPKMIDPTSGFLIELENRGKLKISPDGVLQTEVSGDA